MGALIVDQGLQLIGDRASKTSGFSTTNEITTLSVDDSATALAAGKTNAENPGNFYAQAFDATPTRSGKTVSHVCTIPTGQGNFTIRRFLLHLGPSGSVTATSATLVGGIDAQAIGKTSNFSLKVTLDITYSSP